MGIGNNGGRALAGVFRVVVLSSRWGGLPGFFWSHVCTVLDSALVQCQAGCKGDNSSGKGVREGTIVEVAAEAGGGISK